MNLRTPVTLSCALACALSLTLAALPASAKVSQKKASELGQKLTPIGAEKAGSKDGKIPAWTGKVPDSVKQVLKQNDYESGDFYPILFPNEKPKFRITHDNYQKYAKHLTAGAKQMLKMYPDYYMKVYPTHRIQTYPESIYKATRDNATSAVLKDRYETLKGAHLGFPFPIPKNAAQVIWNHRVRYRGIAYTIFSNLFVVDNGGNYSRSKVKIDVKLIYGNPKLKNANAKNLLFRFLAKTVAPPRLAGTSTLVYDHLHGPRDAWQYNPGLRRIIRAPNIGFDHPVDQSNGLLFNDQVDMYNGSLKLYNWKLIGKKKIYIPYDTYRLNQPDLTYDQIIKPHHLNPKYLRFELHRVWVVQATLKEGAREQMRKRTFYLDEDSWTIAAVDCYDDEGNLWRYQQGLIRPMPVQKTNDPIMQQVVYDLLSGRYLMTGLSNEADHPIKFNPGFPSGYFRPRNVARRAG